MIRAGITNGKRHWIFPGILLLLSVSCKPTSDVFGTYRSNFAIGGFFVTRLVLSKDSTFTYQMQGDLVYDTAAGYYQIRKQLLTLHYRPIAMDSLPENMIAKESVAVHESITGNENLKRPAQYLIGYRRLSRINKNRSKVKRQWGYSSHKRFLLFGPHWFNKQYYLKQIR